MKRNSLTKFLCAFLAICILFTSPIFAHSGRTDGNGGHKDNKNKSGLGYYHYHHGYGPHLHPNGICPYEYTPETSTTQSSKTVESVTNIKSEPKIGIVATDIKTIINSYEVPTFYYNGDSGGTVVIIEDLNNYGFDKIWDNENRTLTLTKNTEKEATPMVMDYYHNLKQGDYLFDIYESDIKVYLKTSANSDTIEPKKVYFLNGYTAISTDELLNFGSLTWDNESRKTIVTIE